MKSFFQKSFFEDKKRFQSFTYLNITQFLGALNDNIFKLVIVFLLIEVQGIENTNSIMALGGLVFVVPFLLFSPSSGKLADKISKRNIIIFTKALEVVVMGLGVVAFALKSPFFSYSILFLMATQSAIFGPSKYGIVPELVSSDRLSKANGLLTSFTFLAIIIGTFLASFLTDITNRNFVLVSLFCTFVALVGFSTSFFIEYTPPAGSQRKFSPFFLYDVYKTLVRVSKVKYLLAAVLGSAYFMYVAAYAQLNIIPYSIEALGLTDVQGGYLFLLTALGIGIGSITAGKLSGEHVELGLVPFGALGLIVCNLLLGYFPDYLYWDIAIITLLGFFGGIYIVPLDTFIQVSSPNDNRGQVVATANFLSFVFVAFASGTLLLISEVFHRVSYEGFLIMGYISIITTSFLTFFIRDHFFRYLSVLFSKLCFKVRVDGVERVTHADKVILLCHHTSWFDNLILMSTQRRLMRFLMEYKPSLSRRLNIYYRLIKANFVSTTECLETNREFFQEIENILSEGYIACIFTHGDKHDQDFTQLRDSIKEYLEGTPYEKAPLIPVTLEKEQDQLPKGVISKYIHKFGVHLSFED